MSGETPSVGPLDRATSLKVKLGLLVASSVAVAAAIGTLGAAAGVAPWLAIPVTVGLALGVTQLLAAGMIAPLREMTAATARMARGDYAARVRSTARDEVGALAASFNAMADDLARVDRERRDLIATVAHELRTPLTALSLRLENLVDGIEESSPTALAELLTQTHRLAALVNDLLDLSRIDAGLRPLALAPLSPDTLVREVVAEVTRASRPVTYDVAVPTDLSVTADPARLRQLLTNVIENAARHSPSDATVRIQATATGERWTLEVRDDGPGVAPEQRERVFERFGTLSGHEGGGTGLGLAIARWVAELHGGTVRFVDPPSGSAGACLRLDLPLIARSEPAPDSPSEEEPTMTVPTPPAAPPYPSAPPHPSIPGADPTLSGWDAVFGRYWPDHGTPGRRHLLGAAMGTGLLAGAVIPNHSMGLAIFLVLAAAGATVAWAAKHRGERFTVLSAALCAVLATTVLLRDATWIVVLCLLVGAGLMAVAATAGRTMPGFVLSAVSWPLAGLRGLPWLGRSARGLAGSGRTPGVLRTAVLSLAGVLVFGTLFASADVLVAHWLSALVPDWSAESVVPRVFITVFVGGVVLAAAYLALNPPHVDPTAVLVQRPLARRSEWLVPTLLIDGVFVVFLIAQLAELFGGDTYVRRTTGLTYSDYAHQGFWQLTLITLLTFLVVWATTRKAALDTERDRAWLRGALGLLAVLTLAVVASALHRLAVYDAAYGFTRTRLLVAVFEGWLGLVVLGVVVAGLRLSGAWLPRFALLTGAAALAGLALINPDAWIARHNIERYEATGKVDWYYLRGLSADAVPAIQRLPEPVRSCATPDSWADQDTSWLSWNLGRARAAGIVTRGDASDAPDPACWSGG